ncbi:hypothetical protein AXE80_07615 [Wenyingzhuangia fucanilytica]|uniref:Thioredoxin domain-containing protein n=1 Tax=Wenyingzhuangia fucanilytica TaxID=1790137 RepID=A0A1B1Y5U2_9FLAO|nr:TlpA disulfide reductase family protein [Wenyingzhuangia fucanilytica]ANW96152.1 hypothetical protein AXE80_07615 [Wenyingzhuangia fucanilytica]
MKKKLFTYLLTLLTLTAFSQKIVENPDYGLSTLPGTISKIEILDNETILHFHLKTTPNSKYSIPKKTYIQDLNSSDKLFITKAEGARISKWETVSESGEADYTLYFPKIDKNVKTIEFGEANNGGSWFVYDIVIEADENAITPKDLLGNWFKTDGSNSYTYSFNSKNVIADKELWNYKSVKSKKNKYTLVLEKNGAEKTINAKLNKDGTLTVKEDKNKKETYSKTIVYNINYHPENNEGLKTPDFKLGTATYSGIIKNYTPKIGIKTGMVYVNNSFTGEQESHLVKIAENGTFSIDFPITHPQFVLSRVFNNNQYIFVAPGKETLHIIDSRKSFFMGDLAQINTDIEKMKNIRVLGITQEIRKNILQTNPLDFKVIIQKQQTEALQQLEELSKTTFISNKGLELKKLSLKYQALTGILSYGMYSSYAKRNLKPEELKDLPEYKIDKNYLSEITPDVLNNQKAIMTEGYGHFTNYFTHLELFSNDGKDHIDTDEILAYLKNQNLEVSQIYIDALKNKNLLNTPEKQERENEFNKKYRIRLNGFLRANSKAYNKIIEENPNKDPLQVLKEQLKKEGKLSSLDEELLIAANNKTTPEEKAAEKKFQEKYGENLKEFYSKYSKNLTLFYSQRYIKRRVNKMRNVLNIDQSFVFNIVTLSGYAQSLQRNMVPYTDKEISTIKKEITDPIIAQQIEIVNNNIKSTIEANKTKTGYHVNKIDKNEGDELFESMIAKFKGKVIYVDFWATWCGPCISSIKKIVPLKEEMADKDVVFLYISAPSSPENTWKNMIPNIKGEHYRVSNDEWNYLTDKFNIRGIPHYALVNKKGELVNPKLGHNNNTGIKKILETELNK